MDVSPVREPEAWADWPTPSPTSRYNINVRFYTATREDASLRLDIGPENERMLEGLYVALRLAERRRAPMLPADYERYLRALYQTRLDTLLPYTLQLVQYVVLTADMLEVNRVIAAERNALRRTRQLLPFRLSPGLIDSPKGWRAKIRFHVSHLWTRLRLLFPLS